MEIVNEPSFFLIRSAPRDTALFTSLQDQRLLRCRRVNDGQQLRAIRRAHFAFGEVDVHYRLDLRFGFQLAALGLVGQAVVSLSASHASGCVPSIACELAVTLHSNAMNPT